MQDYAGNSNKGKEDNKEPKKRQQKAVKSEAVLAKPSLTTRFKNVFFGGDINNAAQYVLSEVLLPALRNLVADSVTKGVDRFVYGDSSYRRRPPTSYSPRVQYNRPVDRGGYQPRGYLPGQPPQGGRKMFEDVIVGTKEDADVLIERVGDVVDSYQVVSIADVLDILGLESTHVDNKWGWSHLPSITVQQVREGWRISFPTPEEI